MYPGRSGRQRTGGRPRWIHQRKTDKEEFGYGSTDSHSGYFTSPCRERSHGWKSWRDEGVRTLYRQRWSRRGHPGRTGRSEETFLGPGDEARVLALRQVPERVRSGRGEKYDRGGGRGRKGKRTTEDDTLSRDRVKKVLREGLREEGLKGTLRYP